VHRLLAILITAAVVFIEIATVAILVGQFDTAEREGRRQFGTQGQLEITVSPSSNLPAPRQMAQLLVGAASHNSVNLMRIVAGVTSDSRQSTTYFLVEGLPMTQLLSGLRLESGRWPSASELARTNQFASSHASDSGSQIGVIADLLHNDEVSVRPLSEAFGYVPVAGTYFVEGDQASREAFMEEFAGSLGDPAVTPESLLAKSPNQLASRSSGLEGLIAAVVGALSFTLLMLIYYQVASAKRIGVMRMLGMRRRDQWMLSIGRWLLPVTAAGTLVSLGGLFSVADLTPDLAIRGLLQVLATAAIVLCLSAAATAVARRIKLSDALKNKRPIQGLFLLGGIIKTVAAALFIVTVGGIFNSLAVASAEQRRLEAWIDVSNYGVFYPKSVGNDLSELQSGQSGSTIAEVYDLYPALDKAGALFIDVNGIRAEQPPAGVLYYSTMRVNPNYLRQYPIQSITGSGIKVANEERNWVVLVPEKYRDDETEIVDFFQSQRTGAGTSRGAIGAELEVLGRAAPLRFESQKVEIMWVKDDQFIPTLSTEFPEDGSGAIAIPIIEVVTEANSLGIDRANAFSGQADSPMKVRLIAPGQTAATYSELERELVNMHLDDNLTNLVTPSEVIESQLAILREGIRITFLSSAISLVIMILLGAQNVSLSLDRFGRSATVKRFLGYSFALRHRPTLVMIAATWIAQVLLAAFLLESGFAMFGNASLLSVSTAVGIGAMLAVEFLLTAAALAFNERRLTLAVLKGNE
jgi:putative ABC transport system permease protein